MDENEYREEAVPQENSEKRDTGDYAQARPMGFDLRPLTLQFDALTDEVGRRLEAWETSAKPRAYRRGKKANQFRRSVGRVLADLVMAADRDPLRWSYR